MALSDDVASLKVKIHKLAIAIEELAIRRYVQGDIDISKLPWFIPNYVPGDSIKVSSSRFPTATANSEVMASPFASFPNASDKSLGAHQMFDEIPEPNTRLNQAQMVGVDLVHETNPSILSKEAIISCAHQVFDKIPEPISHLNQVPMLSNNGDNTRNHLIAESSAMPCVKLAENEALPTLNVNAPNELSSAHNMFDKLPVPTFILEMAQATKTTQENEEMADAHQLFDAMPEPVLCESQIVSSEENDAHIVFNANEMIVSYSGILQHGEVVCDEGQVLDEMSDSILSSNDIEAVLFNNESALVYNNDSQVDSDALEPHNNHDSMSNEVLNSASGPIIIDSDQSSSAHNVFRELPEPNVCFIYTPILTASIAHKLFDTVSQQDNSSKDKNGELEVEAATIDMGYEYPSNSCMFGQQILARVDELDYSSFTYLVNINSIGAQIRKPLTLSINNFHYQTYQVTTKPIYSFTEVENVSLYWGKRNTHFEGLVQNMMFEMECSCRFVFDPGVLLKVKRNVEISLLTIFLNLQNGWNTSVEGQKLHKLGKLFVHLALGETLIDSTLQSLYAPYADLYYLFSKALAHNILILKKAHSKNVHICLRVHLFYLPLILDCWQPSILGLSFAVSVLSDWLTKQEFLHSYKPHFSCSTLMLLALVLTLEDKGDFKREGEYAMRTYSIYATNGHVTWPKEYRESKNLIWDPDIIAKIAYEQFRTSNLSRVGCWKDIILLTLGLMKYWAASSRISDVGTLGFDNFEYGLRSFKISEVLLLGRVEQWSITMRTMLEKNSARKDPTINCKFSTIMTISSLVFDPGGWKYNLSHVESLTSMFVQPTEILSFFPCFLAQLNLLQFSDCADHEGAILVFDPGGCGNGQKVIEQPKACQYGGGRQLKSKGNEDGQIYVFDPGGQLMRFVIKDMVTNSQPGVYYAMSCFKY